MGVKDRGPEYWIEQLGLEEHPEGGWYRRVYEAAERIPASALPARFGGDRPAASAIYYLLLRGRPSRLHRIRSDELWHFYTGGAARLCTISPRGERIDRLLGPDPEKRQTFQAVVPHGSWFAAEVLEGEFSLFGCTVAPGFEFEDLELADREELCARFPGHRELIERLTPAAK